MLIQYLFISNTPSPEIISTKLADFMLYLCCCMVYAETLHGTTFTLPKSLGSVPKVFGVYSQSLWGALPKSLGCIPKVFGAYCQSLWGVLPKTFAYHCLYHKALMFVPYNFMFYTITIHQKSRVCIHSLAVYDLQVP